MILRKPWHPTPVLLPGKSHGWRSLVCCSPWGLEESDTTERLHFHFSLSCFGEGNGSPLQCSCLENPRDRGAWWAAIYGVAQSRPRLKRLSSSSSSRTENLGTLDMDTISFQVKLWTFFNFIYEVNLAILTQNFKMLCKNGGKFWLEQSRGLNYSYCCWSLSPIRLFATPGTVAHQAPLSTGFPRQEYCHMPLQGIFLTQGSNLCLLHCRWILYCWASREAQNTSVSFEKIR